MCLDGEWSVMKEVSDQKKERKMRELERERERER